MNKVNWLGACFLAVGLTACGIEDGDDKPSSVDGGVMVVEGPQGPAGEDGVDGTDGTNGADGEDGAPGADGADGEDGARGARGADGVDGTDGMNGADGEDGAPGADGADGADGETVVIVCGDNTCNGSETVFNCPEDCGMCGNGVCDEGEDYLTCADDCVAPPTDGCGDGECDVGETHASCGLDCAAKPGPFQLWHACDANGCSCSIGMQDDYMSGAECAELVGQGADFLGGDWGSPTPGLFVGAGNRNDQGYVIATISLADVAEGTYDLKFNYLGSQSCSTPLRNAWAQWGDTQTQLPNMSESDLAVVYCEQFDPESTQGPSCKGRATFKVFVNADNQKDCEIVASGNAADVYY